MIDASIIRWLRGAEPETSLCDHSLAVASHLFTFLDYLILFLSIFYRHCIFCSGRFFLLFYDTRLNDEMGVDVTQTQNIQ